MNKIKGTFWVWVVVLMVAAVYQMVLIFWENPSKQENTDWYSMAQPDEDGNMLRPDVLYFSLGGSDGSYGRLSKQDASFEDIFQNTYGLLSDVLKNGSAKVENIEGLPWDEEVCVLTYDFAMESLLIKEQIGLEKIEEGSWTEIWVLPARSRRENAKVYLVDYEAQQYLKVEKEAWEREENQQLLELLLQQGSTLGKNYLALGAVWPQPQLAGEFVLESSNYEMVNGARAEMIFQIGQKLNPIQAKKYALGFFQYPDAVTIQQETDQILFTNEKVTVKVDQTGFLQYVETLTDKEKESVGMKEAYQLAVGFLKEDLDWKATGGMDFSFVGYEIQKEGYVFYFTYLIDSIPFRMDQAIVEELHMQYPIRVTVEGSRVRRYERFVLNFSRDIEQRQTLTDTWQNVLNEMIELGWDPQEIPQLTYRFSNQKLVLYWETAIEEGSACIKAY